MIPLRNLVFWALLLAVLSGIGWLLNSTGEFGQFLARMGPFAFLALMAVVALGAFMTAGGMARDLVLTARGTDYGPNTRAVRTFLAGLESFPSDQLHALVIESSLGLRVEGDPERAMDRLNAAKRSRARECERAARTAALRVWKSLSRRRLAGENAQTDVVLWEQIAVGAAEIAAKAVVVRDLIPSGNFIFLLGPFRQISVFDEPPQSP